MTLIILEGPDCAGKTTLAKAIQQVAEESDRRSIRLHDHFSPNQWLTSSRLLGAALRWHYRGHVAIMDRAWVGEGVYPAIYRPTAPVAAWPRWHHGLALAAGALHVFCLPSEDAHIKAIERTKDRREQYDRTTFNKQFWAFKRICHGALDALPILSGTIGYGYLLAVTGGLTQSETNTAVYDMSLYGPDDPTAADQLLTLAAGHEVTERHSQRWLWGQELHSGSLVETDHRVLVVGERSNDPDGPMPQPFFGNRASSRYLARALNEAQVRQDMLTMVNAWDPDRGQRGLKQALEHHWRKVLCLGDEARRQVVKLGDGNRIVHVPHPQYMARFKHGQLNDYACDINQEVML